MIDGNIPIHNLEDIYSGTTESSFVEFVGKN